MMIFGWIVDIEFIICYVVNGDFRVMFNFNFVYYDDGLLC